MRAYQGRNELAGVTCDIAGVGYTAKVVTPGLVNLPDQAAQSQPVTATCRKDDAVRTVVVQAFSRTASQNRASEWRDLGRRLLGRGRGCAGQNE